MYETQNIQKIGLDPITGEVVGPPTLVTTGSRFWANPDPSPDGQNIVASSQVNPEGDLYVIKTDGSGALRQLTSDAAIDRVPRWSPDGAWISAFSDRSGALQVWKVRVDGSDLQQVTNLEGASVPAWDPDGTRLAVTLSSDNPDPKSGGAAIVGADGRSPADRLPPSPTPDPRFVPNSWSQDGRWIAGQTWFGIPGVSVFDLRTRTFLRLAEIGEWPVWLPDSRRLIVVWRGREFHLIDMVSRQTRRIFSAFRDTLGPPRLTRDGRSAYFSRRITESDVWLVNLQ